MKNFFFNPRYYFNGPGAVGILFLRVFLGFAMVMHAYDYGHGKIMTPLNWMGPDVPGVLQALAAVSEFFGGLAIMFGVLTPLACLGVMSTMFVAVLVHVLKGEAYFVAPSSVKDANAYESAAIYFLFALTIFLTGPGLLSVDAALTKLMGKRDAATSTP